MEVGHLMATFKVREGDERSIGFYPRKFRGSPPLFLAQQGGLVTPDPYHVSQGMIQGVDVTTEVANFYLKKEEAERLKRLLNNSYNYADRTKHVYVEKGQFYRAVTLPGMQDGVYNCATWLNRVAFPGRLDCGNWGIPNQCSGDFDVEQDSL
jgi:hypothetical protein